MKNIPNKIYLQVDPEKENPEFFDEMATTWCSDKINDNDIPYYRKQVKVEPEVILPKPNQQSEPIRITPSLVDIDEIFAINAIIHLEYMNDNDIWMSIEADGLEYHIHIETKRAKIKTWAELVSDREA